MMTMNDFVTHIRGHGLVNGSPPDLVLRGLLLDNTLVGGGTTSLCARVGSQGTGRSDSGTSLVDEGIFVKGSDGGVGNLEMMG
jgi:hypothetical protein